MQDTFALMIHAFFHGEWDPACVGADPNARDEYHGCEGSLRALVRTGAMDGPAQVRAFVEEVEEATGINAPDRTDRITRRLTALIRDEVEAARLRLNGGRTQA